MKNPSVFLPFHLRQFPLPVLWLLGHQDRLFWQHRCLWLTLLIGSVCLGFYPYQKINFSISIFSNLYFASPKHSICSLVSSMEWKIIEMIQYSIQNVPLHRVHLLCISSFEPWLHRCFEEMVASLIQHIENLQCDKKKLHFVKTMGEIWTIKIHQILIHHFQTCYFTFSLHFYQILSCWENKGNGRMKEQWGLWGT